MFSGLNAQKFRYFRIVTKPGILKHVKFCSPVPASKLSEISEGHELNNSRRIDEKFNTKLIFEHLSYLFFLTPDFEISGVLSFIKVTNDILKHIISWYSRTTPSALAAFGHS